ncbi:MAG: glycosyltransferase [Alphaproteobacteria bacterium]|nr:glycosyltransferase [Alphaproteobacteria bacterium]
MVSGSNTLGLTWALSSLSGYGVYGTRLALSWLKSGRGPVALYQTPLALSLNPLEERRLALSLAAAKHFEASEELIRPAHPVLHGLGNGMAMHPLSDRVWGQPDIGCIAFEDTRFSPPEIERAKRFARLIAISAWNAQLLKGLGFENVVLARQGVSPDLFHPRPRRGMFGERFVVFSGGKLEYRKGQDIVLAAFRLFRQRHPEALLLTAWQSPHAEDAKAFELVGHVAGLPEKNGQGGLRIADWAAENGVPEESFIDLGYVPNAMMPAVLGECDAALFPNRCEGGTNLVAMECLAMGLPTILAANTGQKDVLDLVGGVALGRQGPVLPAHLGAGVDGWGESDVEEALEALEAIYQKRERWPETASKMMTWDWDSQNERLFQAL